MDVSLCNAARELLHEVTDRIARSRVVVDGTHTTCTLASADLVQGEMPEMPT